MVDNAYVMNGYAIKRTAWFLVLLPALAARIPAQLQAGAATAPKSEEITADAAAANRGRKQFGQSCGFCHGPDATGGAEGPNLMRSTVVRHDTNGDLIGQVIREGRPNAGMPPVQLDQAQISDVVAFLHARLAISDRTSAGEPARDYSLRRLLTGNAEAGKAYFNGAGGCSHCHSPSGDLAGIAKKFAPIELQARFLYPKGQSETATITLASGTQLKGTLLHRDAFYIAIQDELGWYHSWPVQTVKVAIHDPLEEHVRLLSQYTNTDVHNLFAYLETLK
jgi:cytochrome c oxidase cbb3-type subunit 3